MQYIELLGIDKPFYKTKLVNMLLSIPSPYSLNEIKLIIDKVSKDNNVRFEFDLSIDKAMSFVDDLLDYGFLLGESSFHEEDN